MIAQALNLNAPGMLAATRSRLASTNWRLAMGGIFAISVALVLSAPMLALGWLALLWASLAADYLVGARYLAQTTDRGRTFFGGWFTLLCAVNICVFCAMALYLAWAGGPAGRVLCVLMATSTLLSAMMFFHQAPTFMLIIAAPCVACLGLACVLPFGSQAAADWLGQAGMALGLLGFLAYLVRSARNNWAMLRNLEKMRDLAAQREAEAQAKRLEAETANRAKTAFLTTMTHELRTPLNAVIGYAEMIAEDLTADGRSGDDAYRIAAAAHHLLGLISRILQFSNVDSEGARESWDVDVREILEAAVAAQAETMSVAGNRCTLSITADLDVISTDGEKLSSCVTELLSNAAKFTRNGVIAVNAQIAQHSGQDWLSISVADDGVGMTAQQIAAAFQAFSQANDTLTREAGGIGLGLALAKRLAEALGGAIDVASELGVGSTFTLRLPVTVARR